VQRKIILISFLSVALSFRAMGQSDAGPKAKGLYLNASVGLSRSEDGLAFLKTTSTSQWKPMVNIGAGYRITRYLGIELSAATMVGELRAEGTLLLTSQKAKISARHSNLIFSPVLFLPVADRSEVFFRPGLGFLFSRSELAVDNVDSEVTNTSNLGYMVTLGYAHKLSDKLKVTLQFDFSDAYGEKKVWTGDLGLLHAGIRHSF
jgi:opacity protein-like surface antigen